MHILLCALKISIYPIEFHSLSHQIHIRVHVGAVSKFLLDCALLHYEFGILFTPTI